MIIAWTSTQPFIRHPHSSLVKIRGQRKTYLADQKSATQKKPLQYFPWKGTFYFWYRRRLFTYQSTIRETQWNQREEISISCFDTFSETLDRFLQERREEHLKLVEERTPVFENRDSEWRSVTSKRVRPLDTVVIDQQAKQAILSDIEDFLNPTSQQWYLDQGQPYRRGFLFYGPPGTGKSSLSLSIAGHCDLDLYIVHLSSTNDQCLSQLFEDLPSRCVVLLEDIDAIKATEARGQPADARLGLQDPNKEQIGLSLSGLLNVLDGVASQEGCIIIMTANHIERLDAAVIRSGRTDLKIELGLADKIMAAELFSRTYQSFDGITASTIQDLAASFAEQIPDLTLSAAEIMSYLKVHRKSPENAIKGVPAWHEEREKLKRADSCLSL
jgi:mitochondrial chaperone BCS1